MRPVRVAGVAVERVVEEWAVVDRWWTDEPERREYLVVALADGRGCVLQRVPGGAWDLHGPDPLPMP